MTDELDRFIARKFGRRDLLRYAGVAAGAGVLAACKKATTSGSAVSGSPSTHPSISSEPGDLAVFDWAGYGGGEYYPGKEKANLWAAYQKATGDTPKFILFANDDDGYTKTAAGSVNFDVIHPCAYRFKDYVDLGAVQPWDTSLIPNYAQMSPKLETAGQIDAAFVTPSGSGRRQRRGRHGPRARRWLRLQSRSPAAAALSLRS